VYRGPHFPRGADVGARFGEGPTLLRYIAAPGSGDVRAGEQVAVLLRWDRAADRGELVNVALVGPDGRVLVQDERPVGADGPDEQGLPGGIHRLTIPNRPLPGEYRVVARVTEGRGRPGQAVTAGPDVGSDTVTLRTILVSAER